MQDPNKPAEGQKPQTTLTNPPLAQDKLAQAEAKPLVRVKVLRPINHKGKVVEPAVAGAPPTIIECTEEEAKQYCDKAFKGPHPFFGERFLGENPGTHESRDIRRAARA